MDDELITALSEPRYPCPDGDQSLHVIILTQSVYLCQLFLHLQEFDPCATGDDDEECLRIFQHVLAGEFNAVGPALDGLVLERVVRGLMLAQREESRPSTLVKIEPDSLSVEDIEPRLQRLLVAILEELNRPLYKEPVRYEAIHGPRTTETWAARFATRVMQWRALVRDPRRMIDGVVEVQQEDVSPLDAGGLEVYRLVRDGAPGTVHIVTPLQPPIMRPPLQPSTYAQRSQRSPRAQQAQLYQQDQQLRSISGSMGLQQMVRPTVEDEKSGSTTSETSDTPQTTPHHPKRAASLIPEAAVKRGSQDRGGLPPSKRPKSIQASQSTSRDTHAVAGVGAESGIAIRTGMEINTAEGSVARNVRPAGESTNTLLRRALDGIGQLGQKMDDMRQEISARFDHLDHRIRHIADWIGIAEDEG